MSNEIEFLQGLFHTLENEVVVLCAKLQDMKGELQEEICHLNERLVEENCQQLLVSDNTITEKEEIIPRSSRQLQDIERWN